MPFNTSTFRLLNVGSSPAGGWALVIPATGADVRIPFGGANGIPYNDSSGQLAGTIIPPTESQKSIQFKDEGTDIGGLGAITTFNFVGAAITGTVSGTNLTLTSTAAGSFSAVGSTPNANGGVISSGSITLEPADATHPGVVTAIAQTFGGTKTIHGGLVATESAGNTTDTAGFNANVFCPASTANVYPTVNLGRFGSTSFGNYSLLQPGDIIASFNFYSGNGNAVPVQAATYQAVLDAAGAGTNFVSSRHQWYCSSTTAYFLGMELDSAAKLFLSGESVQLNADAAGSGADWKLTIARPTSGMTAAWTLTLPVGAGSNGQFMKTDGVGNTSWASAGTVTSVALSLPSFITVGGSPITGSGTLTGTLATQSANTIFAGPSSGSAAAPTFRAPVLDDVPTTNVNALTISSGVVNIDCSLGDYFTLSLSANVTSITFTNLPSSGKATTKMLKITQNASAAKTVAFPASFKWQGGVAGVVSTGLSAVDELAITTHDQGTSWQADLGKAYS